MHPTSVEWATARNAMPGLACLSSRRPKEEQIPLACNAVAAGRVGGNPNTSSPNTHSGQPWSRGLGGGAFAKEGIVRTTIRTTDRSGVGCPLPLQVSYRLPSATRQSTAEHVIPHAHGDPRWGFLYVVFPWNNGSPHIGILIIVKYRLGCN